jgi:hypothetical protein
MKFLVPNYSCLQNPWQGGYRSQIPVLSVLCPQLNLSNAPPRKKFLGTPLTDRGLLLKDKKCLNVSKPVCIPKKETFTPMYICYHSCVLRHSNAVIVSKYLHRWQLYMLKKNGCEFPWHYPTTDTHYFSLSNLCPSKNWGEDGDTKEMMTRWISKGFPTTKLQG